MITKPLYYQNPNGELEMNFHRGQIQAWNSQARIICVLAGTQSGKTSFGPFWLAREISLRGPGDYLVVSPTFALLSQKLFPEFLRLFKTQCKWGDFTGRGSFRQRFMFSPFGCKSLFGRVPDEPTQVFFGHAQDSDSLESSTAKGIWLDEAGQKKFRVSSWEAVQRRGAMNQARILITTTPYTLGWLQDLVYEPWRRCKSQVCRCKEKSDLNHKHPYIEVINFKSTENPLFPLDEYEQAKRTMPTWKHMMFYDGKFVRPAGSIYDCFNKDIHVIPPFAIPDDWPRFLGLDFGGVHTAGVFLAKGRRTGQGGVTDNEDKYFLYREYPERSRWESRSAKDHVKAIKTNEPPGLRAVGGAGSEDQWREEFRIAGLYVHQPPIRDVEPGIDRVYSTISSNELYIFDHCSGALDDIQKYSRELDAMGEPTERIEDKDTFHYVDSIRYVVSYIKGPKRQFWMR